jgi:uncharacterized protein (DUF983 family)
MSSAKPATALAIFHQLCPRCRRSKIFQRSIWRGVPRMHECCPQCGLKFEREQGYFLGAMYISYGLALVIITLLTVFVMLVTGWELTRCVIAAVVLFLPLALPVTYFSRVLWIWFDQSVDPAP